MLVSFIPVLRFLIGVNGRSTPHLVPPERLELSPTYSKEQSVAKIRVRTVHMAADRSSSPIYGGSIVHIVRFFHRLSRDLHHNCPSRDEEKPI